MFFFASGLCEVWGLLGDLRPSASISGYLVPFVPFFSNMGPKRGTCDKFLECGAATLWLCSKHGAWPGSRNWVKSGPKQALLVRTALILLINDNKFSLRGYL